MSLIGKAKYGSSGGSYAKTFKIQSPKAAGETTNNVYRFLPPLKQQAESGRWALYVGQHYGYKVRDRQDPTKRNSRTFRCVEEKDFRTGMIRVECPECQLIAAQKQRLENQTAQAKASGKSQEEVDLLTTNLREWLKDHNVDRKWLIHAMNEQGEFGTFYISHRTKKQLDGKIGELRGMDVDPLDPAQGVWFNIKRTGKFRDAQDTVEVVMEVRRDGGRITQELKLAPLSEAQLKQALDVLPDLTEVVTVLGRDQIGALVTGSGDPEEVEAVFNMGTRRETPRVYQQSAGLPVPTPTPIVISVSAAPVAPVAAPEAVTEPESDDGEAALLAQLAALKAAKAAKAAPAVAAAPLPIAAPTIAATTEDMSNEDFLKLFPPPAR